ncbi:MAG: hypothetical protein IT239_05625 [Bacteroidia bacterium]|nr:hypothetical protein [Bacteroidia bacterium]
MQGSNKALYQLGSYQGVTYELDRLIYIFSNQYWYNADRIAVWPMQLDHYRYHIGITLEAQHNNAKSGLNHINN